MKRYLKVISIILSLIIIISMIPFASAGAETVSKPDSDVSKIAAQSLLDDQGVKSIEVTKAPSKQFIANNEYYLYAYYMLAGMEIKVTYDDDTEVYYNYEDNTDFFGYDLEFSGAIVNGHTMTPVKGENTIYVTYCGQKASFTISCLGVDEFEITRIEATKDFIANKEYQIFGSINYEIRVKYSDGTSYTYDTDNDWGIISDLISFSGECITDGSNFTLNEGQNTLYMNCGGKSDDFQLTGLKLKNLEIIETPNYKFLANKTYDTSFNLLGLKLKVTYTDDTSKTYCYEYSEDWDFFLSDITYSGECMDEYTTYFTPKLGQNTIILTYADKSVDYTFTALEVNSITVNKSPNYKFVSGINYYLMYYLYGLEITAEYSDNSTETYLFDDNWNFFYDELKYSGENVDEEYNLYITPELGENTIKITYGSASVDFKISAFHIQSMELVESPTGTFIAGEEYDPDFCFGGIQVRVNYSDNTSLLFIFDEFWYFFQEELEFSSTSLDENGRLIPVVGENKITASCDGKSFEFNIYADNEVEGIEVTAQPTQTEFTVGNKYNIYNILAGMGLTVNYVNEDTKTYTYEENESLFRNLKFSGNSISEDGTFTPVAGENVITVTYQDKTAELKLTGVEPEPVLVSINITKQPAQTEFTVGKEYNIYDCLAGMEVTLKYNNDKTEVYTYENNKEFFEALKLSGKSISTDGKFTPVAGENVITVTYQDKTAELKLTGVEPEPVLVSINITKQPAQTEFTVGKEYNIYDCLAGMEVTLKYNNDKTEVYTYENNKEFFEALKLSGKSISTDGKFTPVAGENIITITCGEKTTEFIIMGIEEYKVNSGDVDGDGELTIKDATYIQLYLANLIGEDELNLDVADFDNDGDINVKDVTFIQMKLANLL